MVTSDGCSNSIQRKPEFILYLKEVSLIFLKAVLQITLAVSSRILTIFWRLHHISLPSLEEGADFAKVEIVSTRSPSLFVFFVTKIPSWPLATSSKVTQYVKELNHRTTKWTYATGRAGKEDGKPCVTSVTIILFEITLRQSSLSFKQMFLQRPENINFKWGYHDITRRLSAPALPTIQRGLCGGGRHSPTRIGPRRVSSEKRFRHIYFMEDNWIASHV